MSDATLTWAVLAFLGFSFLFLPSLYLLERFPEWNRMRKWRKDNKASVLRMPRKR